MHTTGQTRLWTGVLVGLLCASCSTKQVYRAPAGSMDPASDAVVVTVTGLNVDQAVVDRLAREIKGRLILAGFDRDKD